MYLNVTHPSSLEKKRPYMCFWFRSWQSLESEGWCELRKDGWNDGKAVQRGTQPALTTCLAPKLSVGVACTWWIRSHLVRRGYGKSVACQRALLEHRGEMWNVKKIWPRTGRCGPCELLGSTVNWSLWGQGPRPWARCTTIYLFFNKDYKTSLGKNKS